MGLVKLLTHINWVDIIILVLLFRVCYVAFVRGLGAEIMPLVGVYIALVCSLNYYGDMGEFITAHTPIPGPHADFFSYLIIALSFLLVFRLLVVLIVGRAPNEQIATFSDSIFGLLAGIVRGVLLVALVVLALELAPSVYVSRSAGEKSLMAKRFMNMGRAVRSKTMRVLRATRY
jgi:membrane protein required for colicin V production